MPYKRFSVRIVVWVYVCLSTPRVLTYRWQAVEHCCSGSKDWTHQSPRVQTCNAPAVCLASWQPPVAVQGESSSSSTADKEEGRGRQRAGLAGCGCFSSIWARVTSISIPTESRAPLRSSQTAEPGARNRCGDAHSDRDSAQPGPACRRLSTRVPR